MTGRVRSLLLVAASIVAVALVVALTPVGTAIADTMKPLLVQVVNPLQVSGPVEARQSGTWTFDVASPVFVGNSDANPVLVRDVDNAARRAFTMDGGCTIGPGGTECQDSFDVPAGHRLVIETISVELVGPVGTTLGRVVPGVNIFVASENGTATPVSRKYVVPVEEGRFVGLPTFLGLAQVRLYADPVPAGMGNSVLFKALRNSGSNQGMIFNWSISGYTVKCGGIVIAGCGLP